MKKKDEKTVSFEYRISPNYILHAISGVFGGLNAQGDIIMNFFSERHPIPKKATYKVAEDGSLVDPPETEEVASLIRNVPLGMSISPQTARTFAKWLTDKADEFDKIMEKGKQNE